MDSRMKMSALLLGGYLLGRTKKGGMALRLATNLATSGQQGRPAELARDNMMRLVQSAETEQLIQGLRGQLAQAVQAAFDARVAQLTQTLTDRTEALNQSADKARGATEDATKEITGHKDEDSADEEQQPEDQEQQPEEQEQEEDSGAVEGSRTHADEEEPAEQEQPQDSADEGEDTDEELEERIEELKSLRITSLRKMAKELRFEEEGIVDAEKDDLAVWIAEAEFEDAANEGDSDEEEPEGPDEPEEPEEPKAEKPSRREREKAGAR